MPHDEVFVIRFGQDFKSARMWSSLAYGAIVRNWQSRVLKLQKPGGSMFLHENPPKTSRCRVIFSLKAVLIFDSEGKEDLRKGY